MTSEKKQNNSGTQNKSKKTYQSRSLMAENPASTIKRLFSYFRYDKAKFIFGLVMIAVQALALVVFGALIKPITNSMVYDRDPHKLFLYVLLLIVVILLQIGSNFGGQRSMMIVSQNITHRLRSDVFSRMMGMPISFFDQNKHGTIMSTYTNDVDMVSQALQQAIPQALYSSLSFIGTIIMMLVMAPLLTLIVFAMLALMLVIAAFIGRISSRNFRAQQQQLANLNGYIEEMMKGQKVVKVFSHEDKAIEEFAVHNEDLRQSATRASSMSVLIMPVMGNLSYVMYALVAMLGGLFAVKGFLDIGTITAFLQFTRQVSQPITQFSNQMNVILAALAGAERIFKMLDQPLETDDGVIDLDLDENGVRYWLIPQKDGSVKRQKAVGHIRFYDVDFGYVEGQTVLKHINLWAKPGEKIAFVGSTGAGKTTITNLINRFYEIRSGRITFDGFDIQTIKKSALRRTLGMVLQDVHLFEGTVKENIRYGRLDATDEEVERAARLANAHSYICRMPEGYDSMLSPDGQNLSMGERQLLSIARAAVADPLVLILDEATSSVDTRTERHIEKGMDQLMTGRTTFAIAHRLSTVRHSDAILVLESGEIIERGEHAELMSQKGRYYELSSGKKELD